MAAGYGADAICPYLAIETLFAMQQDGHIPAKFSRTEILNKYITVSARHRACYTRRRGVPFAHTRILLACVHPSPLHRHTFSDKHAIPLPGRQRRYSQGDG